MRLGLFFLVIFLFFQPARGQGEEGRVFTLWPLVDYRRSAAVDYASLNLLGPIFNYERKGPEREFGLRPLYFHAVDTQAEVGYSEYLYPVASRRSEPDQSSFQVFHLLSSDFGSPVEGSDNEFMLFPLIFYGRSDERGPFFALFPLGGKLYDKFGRDEIEFALFPAYGRTRRGDTITTNVLWPVFASIRGEEERGVKFWPLFGAAEKEGVYRKRFFLWPVFFRYDLALDTENPVHRRTVFPFWAAEDSPQVTTRYYLWPFFSHVQDRRKDYVEWNFPWPLFRVARGEYREVDRYLPLYADERIGAFHKRWYLWPLYKVEETSTELLHRRRDRVLYFLYSDLEETVLEEGSPRKKRVALWPLFTYERIKGVSRFNTLSLLEPFFPENEAIQRNWSPLWRFYQRKWDGQGNEVSSLLWNLYWKERRGEDLALELFPLFFYRREDDRAEISILKGLFRYRQSPEGKGIRLFFLPWGDRKEESPAKG